MEKTKVNQFGRLERINGRIPIRHRNCHYQKEYVLIIIHRVITPLQFVLTPQTAADIKNKATETMDFFVLLASADMTGSQSTKVKLSAHP
jgi:hypothetical protein